MSRPTYRQSTDIDLMRPASGRVLEEDNTVTNILDLLRGVNVSGNPIRAQLTDAAGRLSTISTSGELLVGSGTDDVSINFHYGVSPLDIAGGGVTTGTGTLGQDGAMATVSCGTGVGKAELTSRASVRYRAGHETYCAPSVVFAPPEPGVNQHVGLYDGDDGLCIGYQGLVPGIWLYRDGDPTFVPQSGWNIDPVDGTGQSGYEINLLAGQVPELKFVWHGLKNLTLEIVTDDGRLLPCHKFEFVNTSTTTHLSNPILPVSGGIERVSGTGQNLTIKFGSWRAGSVVGAPNYVSDRRFDYSNLNVAVSGSATVRQVVLGLRNTTTHRGKHNHIRVESSLIQFIADGTKAVLFEAWTPNQGTLSTPLIYTDRDPISSVMQYSTTGATFTPDAGQISSSNTVVSKVGQVSIQSLPGQGARIYPGDEIMITAISTNGSDVGVSIRTLEQF